MPQVWFTADTHFGHGNIIKNCQRPFLNEYERTQVVSNRQKLRVSAETVARHDTALIDAINAVVQPADTLWILGDFCWGKQPEAERYRKRVRCRDVRLVRGNHDHKSVDAVFSHVYNQVGIKVAGQSIWLNHYPMRTWDKSHRGAWQLYGHEHGRLVPEDAEQPHRLTRDVGVDACDYAPISFEMLQSEMKPRTQAFETYRATMYD